MLSVSTQKTETDSVARKDGGPRRTRRDMPEAIAHRWAFIVEEMRATAKGGQETAPPFFLPAK